MTDRWPQAPKECIAVRMEGLDTPFSSNNISVPHWNTERIRGTPGEQDRLLEEVTCLHLDYLRQYATPLALQRLQTSFGVAQSRLISSQMPFVLPVFKDTPAMLLS